MTFHYVIKDDSARDLVLPPPEPECVWVCVCVLGYPQP